MGNEREQSKVAEVVGVMDAIDELEDDDRAFVLKFTRNLVGKMRNRTKAAEIEGDEPGADHHEDHEDDDLPEDEIVRFFGTLDKRARVALDLRYQIAGMEGGDGKFGDRVDDASDVCPEDLEDDPELLRLLGIAEGMELHQRLQR